MAERICSVQGCAKKHRARGLCVAHWTAARRKGTFPPVQLSLESTDRHSLSNIDKENRTADCAVCGPGTAIRVRDDKRRPAECKGAEKDRRDRDPDRKARNRAAWLQRAYNLSVAEFDALLEAQGRRCAICKVEPEQFDVDHDHSTGKVRGLLCPPCNRGLGSFRDRRAVVIAAAAYLETHAA